MKILNAAIIGCSKIAHFHAKAILQISNLSFKAVWSNTQQTAKDFANQYQVKAYASIAEMVKTEKIDIAIICTSHPHHAAPAVEAMNSGAHVLIEKPLASTLEDCDLILTTGEETGKKIGVISQRRWTPPVQRMKKAIDEGKLGIPSIGTVQMLGWRDKSYYDSGSWRGTWLEEGGGILVNQAPHQIDMLLWLMGEIDEVYAYHSNINHPYIEVEDTALAVIKFKNGGFGNLMISNSQKPGIFSKVHIHGSNGASVGSQIEGGPLVIAQNIPVSEAPRLDLWTVPGEEHCMEEWNRNDEAIFKQNEEMQGCFTMQLKDFTDAVINSSKPLIDGYDGRKTVELFSAVYRSQRDGKPVKFPLLPEYERSDMDGRIPKNSE